MNGFSCAAAVWLKSIGEVGVLEGVILYGRQLGVTGCVYQQEIWAGNMITLLLVAWIQLSIGIQHLQSCRWLTGWFLLAASYMLHLGIDLTQGYPLILARSALPSPWHAVHWRCAGGNQSGLVLQGKGEQCLAAFLAHILRKWKGFSYLLIWAIFLLQVWHFPLPVGMYLVVSAFVMCLKETEFNVGIKRYAKRLSSLWIVGV